MTVQGIPTEASDSPTQPNPPTATPPRPGGKGFLAVTTSFTLPGLGHLLAGRPRRALFWFLLILGTGSLTTYLLAQSRFFVGALILVPLLLILSIGVYVDALRCGRRSEKRMFRVAWLRFMLGIVSLAVALFLNPGAWFAYRTADYIKRHYAEAFVFTGGSMGPTLQAGDRFIVHKKDPWGRGSLVVLNHPDYSTTVVAMRVVGLPGETIEIRGGEIYVNGEAIERPPGVAPYVSHTYAGDRDPSLRDAPGAGCEGHPIRLQDDEFFVLGDNSAQARDARLWEIPVDDHQIGALPSENIRGPITAIYWPPNRLKLFK